MPLKIIIRKAPMKMSDDMPMKEEDSEPEDEGYDEYELCSACETLAKAEEIKADPKLMAAIKPMLEKKAKSYKSLAALKAKGEMLKKQGL